MEASTEAKSWSDELASLVEDTGIRFPAGDPIEDLASEYTAKPVVEAAPETETESLRDQIEGFAKAWGELLLELGKGCRDILQQTVLTEDSYIVKKTKGPLAEVSKRLSFLNEFLPEDRDPKHVWPVILSVFFLTLAVLIVNSNQDASIATVKQISIHPPSAARVMLPGGRYIAYHEMGVPADKARFSLIIPHGFLSSRLAGVPGIKISLLEEFGVRLISYDLPGFGESDPHPSRDLNSSAMDMAHLASSVGVKDKFWILGYSSGSMHAWAALKYIPHKVDGAALVAPFVNPYAVSMTKQEISKTWENWTRKRKVLYYLARRFPNFLGYFYRRTFLSGKHGSIDKWLSLSLGRKDKGLVETSAFEEIWHRDVEESIRQGTIKPFVEEATLQVSNWGFSLVDLQVQKICRGKGFFHWLPFMYGQPECELTGYLGPIHIWQGMEDTVVPPSMTDYIVRILPNSIVHRLLEEGHFSYFFLCDECHRQILSTLFGDPQGPLDIVDNTIAEAIDEGVSEIIEVTSEQAESKTE